MASEQEDGSGERGALLLASFTVLLILIIATPCCLYLGAGFVSGLTQFQSGQYNNPARTRTKKYTRDPKYDRKHPKPTPRRNERRRNERRPAP